MSKKEGICKVCGKHFEQRLLASGRYSTLSFCSRECEKLYNQKFLITKTRNCKRCGKSFEVERTTNGKNFSTFAYCSEECYRNDLANKYITQCKNCGKNFSYYNFEQKRPRKKDFCSIACAQDYADKYTRKKTICAYCGKEFVRPRAEKSSLRNIKYCSDACRQNAEKDRIKKTVCLNCGKELPIIRTASGSISKRKYCSDTCAHEYYDKTQLKEKICLYCGKSFKPKRLDNGKLCQSNYCSDDCWYKGTQNKFVTTCQRKYGVDYPILLEESQQLQGEIISKVNLKFGELLKENNIGYKIEKRFHNTSFDFELINQQTLIEINPTYTHTVIGNHYNNFQYNEKNGTISLK